MLYQSRQTLHFARQDQGVAIRHYKGNYRVGVVWFHRLSLGKDNYGKGKAIPLQAWTGPEVSRRLRLPDLKKIGA